MDGVVKERVCLQPITNRAAAQASGVGLGSIQQSGIARPRNSHPSLVRFPLSLYYKVSRRMDRDSFAFQLRRAIIPA
jgi:hypothetical protein